MIIFFCLLSNNFRYVRLHPEQANMEWTTILNEPQVDGSIAQVYLLRGYIQNGKEIVAEIEATPKEYVVQRHPMFCKQPKKVLLRETIWCAYDGSTYKYSGTHNKSIPVPHPLVKQFGDDVERLVSEKLGNCRIQAYLINKYANGTESINHHCDDEKDLGDRPVIVSASFGETRVFELKAMTDTLRRKQCKAKDRPFIPNPNYKCRVIPIELCDGDVLVMAGSTQEFFTHALPPSKKSGLRINVTFRPHLTISSHKKPRK